MKKKQGLRWKSLAKKKKYDGKQAYETKEEAEKVADEMGCGGYHEHEVEGVILFYALQSRRT